MSDRKCLRGSARGGGGLLRDSTLLPPATRTAVTTAAPSAQCRAVSLALFAPLPLASQQASFARVLQHHSGLGRGLLCETEEEVAKAGGDVKALKAAAEVAEARWWCNHRRKLHSSVPRCAACFAFLTRLDQRPTWPT